MPDTEICFRLTPRQALGEAAARNFFPLVSSLFLSTYPGRLRIFLFALLALGLGLSATFYLRHETRLTPTHLVVVPNTFGRRRRIAWSDITHMWVGKQSNSTEVGLMVRERSARDTALPAPIRRVMLQTDPAFDAKVDTILRWGNARRGWDPD